MSFRMLENSEVLSGSHEARGSSPLSSTNEIKGLANTENPFFYAFLPIVYHMSTIL